VKPRIVYFGPAYPYRGGIALTAAYIYRALMAEFDIQMLNYKLLYPHFLFPGKTQYDESKHIISEVPSHRLVSSINPLSWYRAARWINNQQPELIIADWWHPFFGPCQRGISGFLPKKWRRKLIFSMHNVVSHEAGFLDNVLTNWGLRHARGFITYSNLVTNTLQKRFPTKPVFQTELPFYHVFDDAQKASPLAARQSLGLRPEDRVLLFFGYVRPYKGLDVLFSALPEMMQADRLLKLIVAGEFYQSPDPYYKQVADTGLSDRVMFINRFIANEEVPNLYATADVVILPYREATQSGIVSMAFALEKPVIATNVGALAETVTDELTGLLVPPENPQALAAAVRRFFDLREKIDFISNIRQRLQSNAFAQFPKLINQILAYLNG
jgi:glycosyltransferase involved in cell wall biosynthesis